MATQELGLLARRLWICSPLWTRVRHLQSKRIGSLRKKCTFIKMSCKYTSFYILAESFLIPHKQNDRLRMDRKIGLCVHLIIFLQCKTVSCLQWNCPCLQIIKSETSLGIWAWYFQKLGLPFHPRPSRPTFPPKTEKAYLSTPDRVGLPFHPRQSRPTDTENCHL